MKTILFALLLSLPFSTSLTADDRIPMVTVTGKSEITVEADYAKIDLNIDCVKDDMDASHDELLKTLSTLIENLGAMNIGESDLTTSIVSQGRRYNWENNSNVFKGYFSGCACTLRINHLARLLGVYRVLSKFRDVSVGRTVYCRSDEAELREEQYREALLAAREKANLMAETLETEIGDCITILELGIPTDVDESKLNRVSEFESDSYMNDTPSLLGTVKISATVLVEFELET